MHGVLELTGDRTRRQPAEVRIGGGDPLGSELVRAHTDD